MAKNNFGDEASPSIACCNKLYVIGQLPFSPIPNTLSPEIAYNDLVAECGASFTCPNDSTVFVCAMNLFDEYKNAGLCPKISE